MAGLLLLIANLISNLGTNITVLAIPWFVLQTTGSAGQIGVVVAATLAPMVISAFIGGALIASQGFGVATLAGTIAMTAVSLMLALNGALADLTRLEPAAS